MGSYQPFDLGDWRPAAAPADCCHAVAAGAATGGGLPDWGEGADFRRFQRERSRDGAIVATVSAVAAPRLPWSDGLDLLARLPCPTWLEAGRWERLVFNALALSRDWGAQADALGWGTLELFGCNPEPWRSRVDRDGLVLSLTDWRGPIRVRAVTAAAIVLEVDHGRTLRHYRHDRSEAVPLWVGYAQEGGP